ncbi:MAG: cob(I)yrinic acid a,c-diamide adenosyltransferase [Chloroflexi bacterium]|nr:cob(I)yrinic acid a,c-diamide adenosyltransferase [Chloroflexota bacterium]
MSKFYTRKGDDGTTGTLGKTRLPKYHPRIEAIGTLDETTATLGLARALAKSPEIDAILTKIQRDIYSLMAEVAATPENAAKFRSIDPSHVEWLEKETDSLSQKVEMPTEFILPGETKGGGALSVARTVVRRAERRVAELLAEGELENKELLRYLNRLSSLCFMLELVENQFEGKATQKAK